MTDFPKMELEAKLSINLLDCASLIELSCADVLLPPPKGIYMKNRLEPVMTDGHNYYVRRGINSELITDINAVHENVYGEDTKLVVPKTFMLKKQHFLSEVPFIPYRGAKILELLVNQRIDNFVLHRHWGVDYRERILRHMTPIPDPTVEVSYPDDPSDRDQELGVNRDDPFDEIMTRLDEAFTIINAELTLWLGSKRWNIYSVRVAGGELQVSRYEDWRIHQWEIKHGEDFRSGRYA